MAGKRQAICLAYQQLRDAITLIAPHVGADDTLPMLTGVQFGVKDGVLQLSGTDRYTMAVVRVHHVDDELPKFKTFTALIRLSDLKRVLAVFKPARGEQRVLLVEACDGKVSFEAADDTAMNGSRLVFGVIDHGFPPLDALLSAKLSELQRAEERLPHSGFRPAMLSRLAALRSVDSQSKMWIRQSQPHEPAIVTASFERLEGVDFLALIMPVRLAGAFNPAHLDHLWPPAEPVAEVKPAAKRSRKKAA